MISYILRKLTLLPVIVNLCNSLMAKSHSHEWMGALPLLHIINYDLHVCCQPILLPAQEKDVQESLFCAGLKVDRFLKKLPSNNRYYTSIRD